jgi:uncharacterized protein (DUF952 family)
MIAQAGQEKLFHIAEIGVWDRQLGGTTYLPAAYDADGFIHLSFEHQVLKPANLFYRGRQDLVLLDIDRDQLDPDVVVEPGTGTDELFPHLYAPLPRAAVANVVPFPCDADGRFSRLPS